MRNTPVGAAGVAPAPLTCGVKNLAATVDITTSAENPWKFGMLTRPAYAGILDLCQPMGKNIGELPSTLKSYALCVYLVMYSPEATRYLPNACSRPTWNSLRQPVRSGVRSEALQPKSGFSTTLAQPTLETIRFSLNGVSRRRA